MIQPFKVGDKVVVRVVIDSVIKIPVFAKIEYAHPICGWCTCNLGVFCTSYRNEEITPLDEWKTNSAPIYLKNFRYSDYLHERLAKKESEQE